MEVEAKEVERATKRGEVRLGEAKETIGDAWAGLGNIAGGKIGCIHSPLVHVTSAKSPQIAPLLDTNEVSGKCKT